MLKNIINKIRKPTEPHYTAPALMNAYSRLPVSFVRGEGARLWDDQGREYLDALGGIAVAFLGHCHPKVSEAISLQANQLLHCSNLFHIQSQAALGEKLCQISGMDKVFFTNSGAEANEVAIKITRLHARAKNIAQPIVLSATDSFHGRTMATISATGNAAIQKNFEPLLGNFVHVAYNSIEALQEHAGNPNVVAVMIEPIQGEAGIVIPEPGYLRQIRDLCDQQEWLMIADEIQTGMGRTGEWFAYQHEEIVPDVVTVAKALGNGIPIGACAARGAAAELICPGSHGSTFGGNPFACQIGLSVIDIIQQENLVEVAAQRGAFLKKQLQQHIGTAPEVVDIRGKGLMLAVELDQVYADLAKQFLAAGLVVNVTGGGKVIRMLPSVMISEPQAKQIATTLNDVINAL